MSKLVIAALIFVVAAGCASYAPDRSVKLVGRAERFIGSEDTSSYGASPYYPKAQAFVAPAAQLDRVALHMSSAYRGTWQVRILTSLPTGGGGRGVINQADLNAKTLGSARVSDSPAGWVPFNFSPPISLRPGQTYFLFIDGYDAGGPTATWSASEPGPSPGSYADGTGWIFVYDWSDNSNYRTEFVKHVDYAFRIYYRK